MASPKNGLLEFEKAIEYMDPMQVTDYLQKTLDFLESNNYELCFPNLSSYSEAFLVGLTNTKNLTSKSLNFDRNKFASDIIEVLELNKDVFRWTYGYENGKIVKNLLVYKKIFTNKINMKPAMFKKPVSSISQRLLQAQMLETNEQTDNQQCSIPTGFKIQILNMTLRFIKNGTEQVLCYPEMPKLHAQYIYSLLKNPKSDMSVGFGYESLYAPIFEAMDVYGLDYEFRISYVETNNCETAVLKLEKISRKINNSSKGDSSLNSSSSSTKLSKKDRKSRSGNKLVHGVAGQFVRDTLQALVRFTGEPDRARVTFHRLTDEEAGFIRGVNTLAGSPESYSMFDPQLRVSLKQLHFNIAEVTKTCNIRIEEGLTKKTRARFIMLKKVPREITQDTPLNRPIARSRSAASAKSGDRSVSRNRSTGKDRVVSKDRSTKKDRALRRNRSMSKDRLIQFKSAGEFVPSTEQLELTTDKPEAAKTGIDKERGLNRRKAKLLEDMSVPLESDKGMRMMVRMGWRGGALGPRARGLLEPLVPALGLPAGAGLGHVPAPARAAPAFRAALLQELRDLLAQGAARRHVQYKSPLSKKKQKFVNTAVNGLNSRRDWGLAAEPEPALGERLLLAMRSAPELGLRADLSKDFKTVTLTKSTNPNQKQLKKPTLKKVELSAPVTQTILEAQAEYETITEEQISAVVAEVIPTISTSCKTPVAVRARATRILFLMIFIDFVRGERRDREFRFEGTLQKKMVAFLEEVIGSVNSRVRSGYVTPEETEWFEELMECAARFLLTIEFLSKSKFILTKKERQSMQYQKRFVNSAWPHPPQNNNDIQTNNQSSSQENTRSIEKINCVKPTELPKFSRKQKIMHLAKEENEFKEQTVDATKKDTEPVRMNKQDREYMFAANPEKVKILLNNEQIDNHEPIVIKDVTDPSPGEVKTEVDNNCDIDCKNKKVENTIEKEIMQLMKEITETDYDNLNSDDKLCVCDTKIISELDTDVTNLELAMLEADLSIKVKAYDNASPGTKRSLTVSSHASDAKKTKITQIKNVLIISPSNPESKITTDIVKQIQTRITNEIDGCVDFLPLLKCHGVQDGGLVYSCHDNSDVDWLRNVIGSADLDLKISKGDSFCIQKRSRRMVIKINSFIPLDCRKVFSRFEVYNDGLHTSGWRVLAEQTYSDYVLFIVEVDEKSFKYISGEGFSLYVGLDKAQFSVIF